MSEHLPSRCVQLVLNSVGKLNDSINLLHNNAYSQVAQSSEPTVWIVLKYSAHSLDSRQTNFMSELLKSPQLNN